MEPAQVMAAATVVVVVTVEQEVARLRMADTASGVRAALLGRSRNTLGMGRS